MAESTAAFIDRRRRDVANATAQAKAAQVDFGRQTRIGAGQPLGAHPAGGSNANAKPATVGSGKVVKRVTTAARHASHPTSASSKPTSAGHPGFGESLIPVWGSGREALADFREGHNIAGMLNGVLAASDLYLGADIAKAVAKGGRFAIIGAMREAPKEQKWPKVRSKMKELKLLKPGLEGHHWAIPQNQWGKDIWKGFTNHPLNIKGLRTETHARLRHKIGDKPRFGLLGRYWFGTPDWSKVATVSAVGHPIAAAEAGAHRK